MTVSYQAKPPYVVSEYGRRHPHGDWASHPIVVAEFKPGRGWRSQSFRKRISPSWARKLGQGGITVVALSDGRRTADFSVSEMARRRPPTTATYRSSGEHPLADR